MKDLDDDKLADTSTETLVLTRVFNAPRALVFKLWTEPEHVARWWGCPQTGTVDFRNDLRPGGEFTAVMNLEGGATHRIWGTYREIVEPERLVFTWSWRGSEGFAGRDTLVTVTLAEKDGGTEVTLRHEAFAETEARDLHGQGWGSSLDRLEGLLAAL